MMAQIDSSKDQRIFTDYGIETQCHCQSVEFWLGTSQVYASSNSKGIYHLRVVFNYQTMLEVKVYVGQLAPRRPFYLWIAKTLKANGYML